MKYIDMFSGIGGFSLGIKAVAPEAECVFACDNDKHAANTYKTNFGVDSLCDIREIDIKFLPDADIVFGGFPCQPFSRNGKYYNISDRTINNDDEDRDDLFSYLIKILAEKKPRYFLFENVKGFLSMKNRDGEYYKDIIIREFQKVGYKGWMGVLDAADFGLAQQRKRVFFVGFREKEDREQFEPPTIITRKIVVEDILDNDVPEKYLLENLWKGRKNKILPGSRLDALKKAHSSGKWETPQKKVDKIAPVAIIYGDTPSGGPRQQDKLYSVKGISPTIATLELSIPSFDVSSGWRSLTPRECARLQGFPDSFRLPDSSTVAFKQVGNAVPVALVKNILKNML